MERDLQKKWICQQGGNDYFERNVKKCNDDGASMGCKLFGEFCENNGLKGENIHVLEVGCCHGYDLHYLNEKFQFEGYGVEPSSQAVAYGNDLYKNIKLIQGTADELPFEDDFFDVVMLGFCLYWVDRSLLSKCVAEADRVLKNGGFLVLWDFDTKIPYSRVNIHNSNANTYKMDLSALFLGNPQYYLCEKRCYNHKDKKFDKDIQERLAMSILYKETEDRSYIFSDVK